MKKISPEEFTEKLGTVCGDNLQSVVLYGSAAAGDYSAKGSDYNLLVVLNDLQPAVLRNLAKPVEAWERAGNPVPLLFTRQRLTDAADIFPIELLDMRDARKVLFGEDVIAGIYPDTTNLRLQVERELSSALIQLRRNYLSVCGSPRRLTALLTGSLSGVLTLFRAALRLYENSVPVEKFQALEKLNGHIPVESGAFRQIQALKTGTVKIKKVDAGQLFEEYMKSIETVVDAVDRI
jgi:predicted nucleotidyltransferase